METVNEERSGLSRRALIKRAAAAGAVAWTAPVIVDSFTSAAFAALPSGCRPYWVKLTPDGGTYNACPATGSGQDCDGDAIAFSFDLATWPPNPNPNDYPLCAWGSESFSSCCANGGDEVVTVSVVGAYHQVTLPSGCYFTPLTGGVLSGRYDKSVFGFGGCSETRFVETCAGGAATGNGRYSTNTGWVKSTVTFGSGTCTTDMPLSYIYVQFCCP